MARTPGTEARRQQASLTFYKIHNNLITIDKYLSEASRRNRSTRFHPFQYHRPNAYPVHGWIEIFPFPPGQLQLGMDLQPKLSLQTVDEFKSKI